MYFLVLCALMAGLMGIMIFSFFYFLILEKLLVFELCLHSFSGVLVDLKFHFYVDYVTVVFMGVVSFISMMTFLYSKSYMGEEKMKAKFLLLTFLFILSMLLMILSMNSWLILFGWDGLGITSYLLVIFYQSEYSNYCGLVTILINRLGDIGLIFSLFFLMDLGGLDYLIVLKFDRVVENLFLFFIVFGVVTKSAQYPFSSWLPLAMAAPTPISALVHSSTLVTAGVYMMIRLEGLVKNSGLISFNMFFFSLVTMLVAGVGALVEMDVKKVIAYSTLSQLGFMMMILLLGNELLAFFHILTHAMFKALLFLCSGVFIHEYLNNQDIRKFKEIFKINNLSMSIFIVCCFNLMGFPFLSGFYSKDLILEKFYSLNYSYVCILLVVLSTLLTSIYSFRTIYYLSGFSKNSMKFSLSFEWNWMSYALLVMYIGVLFIGGFVNWLLVEKLQVFYVIFFWKLLNFTYMILGGVIFYFILLNFKWSKLISYFMSMFFLSSSQGNLSSEFFGRMLVYFVHFEVLSEREMVYSWKSLFFSLSNLLFSMKMLVYFLSIMIIFLSLLLMI